MSPSFFSLCRPILHFHHHPNPPLSVTTPHWTSSSSLKKTQAFFPYFSFLCSLLCHSLIHTVFFIFIWIPISIADSILVCVILRGRRRAAGFFWSVCCSLDLVCLFRAFGKSLFLLDALSHSVLGDWSVLGNAFVSLFQFRLQFFYLVEKRPFSPPALVASVDWAFSLNFLLLAFFPSLLDSFDFGLFPCRVWILVSGHFLVFMFVL